MKKIFWLIFAIVFVSLTLGVPVSAKTCTPNLMSVVSSKKATKLLNTVFFNKSNLYTAGYNNTWTVSEIDFTQFNSTDGLSEVSIGVPNVMLNGGGSAPKKPLKKNIIISGKKATWEQWWDKNQCAEIGKITFHDKILDWNIRYLSTIKSAPTIKAMIYSLKIPKNYLAAKLGLTDGDRIVQKGHTQISYYYKGKRHAIPYQVYSDWYNDTWGIGQEIPPESEIKQLSEIDYKSIPEGRNICHRAGVFLHIADDPNIYYVSNDCTLHDTHITWLGEWSFYEGSKETQELNSLSKKNYKVGEAFKAHSRTSLPEGIAVHDQDGNAWYIATDGKRALTDEGITNNHFFEFLDFDELDMSYLPDSKKGPLIKNEFFLPYQGLGK